MKQEANHEESHKRIDDERPTQQIDDNAQKKDLQAKKESGYEKAGFISRYTFFFMVPLFLDSYFNRTPIVAEKLDGPCEEDESKLIGKKLESSWQEELKYYPSKPNFVRALIRVFGRRFIVISLYELFNRCLIYPMQAVVLGWLFREATRYMAVSKGDLFPRKAALTNITRVELNDTLVMRMNDTRPATDIKASIVPNSSSDILSQIYQSFLLWSVVLILMKFVPLMSSHPFLFERGWLSMKCNISSCRLIYKKSLKLSHHSMSQTSMGQMVNLLSNDVQRFDPAFAYLSYIVIAPIQASIIFFLLTHFYIGSYSSMVVMVSVCVTTIIQTMIGRRFGTLRRKMAKKTDERIRLMSEIVNSISTIKLHGWEQSYRRSVEIVRNGEMYFMRKIARLRTISATLAFVSTPFVSFVAIITCILSGNELDPETVFASFSLIALMRLCLAEFLPAAISTGSELLVACDRIQKFLLLEEIGDQKQSRLCQMDPSKERYIKLQQVGASWQQKETTTEDKSDISNGLTIRNLSFDLNQPELLLIVGKIGSAKSSVLMSIIGELPITSGRIEINGRLSYSSQEAWIFPGTIRDNVLFSRPYDSQRYNEVVRVCSLDIDLKSMQDGDLTLVGERGVSLSGGQKARVNLARALYFDADIYLLDDPLSTVDSPIAKHIFNECLMKFLKNKIVILVTHQWQYLRYASKILLMDNLHPSTFGTLDDVIASQTFFNLSDYSRELFLDATSQSSKAGGIYHKFSRKELSDPKESKECKLHEAATKKQQQFSHSKYLKKLPSERNALDRLIQGKSNIVSANLDTYKFYINETFGLFIISWLFVINVSSQVLVICNDFWIDNLIDSARRKSMADIKGKEFSKQIFVDYLNIKQCSLIYTCLILSIFVIVILRHGLWYTTCMKASITLHERLLISILKAPMIFFDFTPVGILLNRVSKDVGIVDDLLPVSSNDVVDCSFIVTSIIASTIVINPLDVIPAMILFAISLLIRHISGNTVRRLKQMEHIAKSPILSHLSTTINGIATIRVFEVEKDFIDRLDYYQDDHTKASFLYMASYRWVTLWMEWFCLLFVSFLIILVITRCFDASHPTTIDLMISQIMMIPSPFKRGLRQITEMESQMISVQRTKEYSELQSEVNFLNTIPCSGSDTMIDQNTKKFKPDYGDILFRNVTLNYFKQEEPVLKNINFHIRAGEKVAIVGRTGAGKSSIMSVLFRLYPYQGSIFIDSHDTRQIEITQLRRSISIIPQAPVLFSTSIKKNLDPVGEFTDENLWRALKVVKLADKFKQSGKGLQFKVDEGGKNFSIGQRQLICLARAIVRRNKVLLMDEVTANVDHETDLYIQKTILSKSFSHCTLLVITYRLATAMNLDRILVMDAGQIIEFDEPHVLLNKEGSLLAMMVNSTGEHSEKLTQIARESYEAKHKVYPH